MCYLNFSFPRQRYSEKYSQYSLFLLFTVVLVSKVAVNTELVNTIHCLKRNTMGGRGGVSILRASGHSILVSQSIHNLILRVFLFQDTWLNVYCGFINTELTANNIITHA